MFGLFLFAFFLFGLDVLFFYLTQICSVDRSVVSKKGVSRKVFEEKLLIVSYFERKYTDQWWLEITQPVHTLEDISSFPSLPDTFEPLKSCMISKLKLNVGGFSAAVSWHLAQSICFDTHLFGSNSPKSINLIIVQQWYLLTWEGLFAASMKHFLYEPFKKDNWTYHSPSFKCGSFGKLSCSPRGSTSGPFTINGHSSWINLTINWTVTNISNHFC